MTLLRFVKFYGAVRSLERVFYSGYWHVWGQQTLFGGYTPSLFSIFALRFPSAGSELATSKMVKNATLEYSVPKGHLGTAEVAPRGAYSNPTG